MFLDAEDQRVIYKNLFQIFFTVLVSLFVYIFISVAVMFVQWDVQGIFDILRSRTRFGKINYAAYLLRASLLVFAVWFHIKFVKNRNLFEEWFE